MDLNRRVEAFARDLVRREALQAEPMARARIQADRLHARVADALDRFHAVVGESLPALQVVLTPPRLDDKHLHAIEFDLERGRHRAVVTVKSKGEVTLVGPFRAGRNEGPCRTFPFEAEADLEDALGDLLERFLDEATAP